MFNAESPLAWRATSEIWICNGAHCQDYMTIGHKVPDAVGFDVMPYPGTGT